MVVEGAAKSGTGMAIGINGVWGNLGVGSAALITGFLIDRRGMAVGVRVAGHHLDPARHAYAWVACGRRSGRPTQMAASLPAKGTPAVAPSGTAVTRSALCA